VKVQSKTRVICTLRSTVGLGEISPMRVADPPPLDLFQGWTRLPMKDSRSIIIIHSRLMRTHPRGGVSFKAWELRCDQTHTETLLAQAKRQFLGSQISIVLPFHLRKYSFW